MLRFYLVLHLHPWWARHYQLWDLCVWHVVDVWKPVPGTSRGTHTVSASHSVASPTPPWYCLLPLHHKTLCTSTIKHHIWLTGYINDTTIRNLILRKRNPQFMLLLKFKSKIKPYYQISIHPQEWQPVTWYIRRKYIYMSVLGLIKFFFIFTYTCCQYLVKTGSKLLKEQT